MKFAVIILALAACWSVEGNTFTRCELVRQLRKHGFPESELRDWVCLVEHESGRKTNAINRNKNGSMDYGLFKINDKYWCSETRTPGKDCNVVCKDLLSVDITKAATCAKKIYSRHGFNAWYGWKSHCQGSLPDISKC